MITDYKKKKKPQLKHMITAFSEITFGSEKIN